MGDFFAPATNRNIDIRPLNGGMVLDNASQSIPDVAFVKLENFIANKEGPRRRNGYQRFCANDSTSYRMLNMLTLWKTDGTQETILVTDKVLYRVGPTTGLTEIAWAYSTGTVAIASDTAVTGTSTAWLSADVQTGDLFRCGGEESEIASVDSDTGITLKSALSDQSAGTAYSIQRAFRVNYPNYVDFSTRYGDLLLCDGSRPIMEYDAETGALGYYTVSGIGGSEDVIPICVARFVERTFVGYLDETTDGIQRQRIRWDLATFPGDFSTLTAFLGLNQTGGSIRRLVPNGNVLTAYLDDGVYFLIPTNLPLLPLRPEKIETGGLGLLGQRAVTSWLGGHFFVAQNEIFFLGNNGPEPIGSPIVKAALKGCRYPEDVQVSVDPMNTRILFGIPQSSRFMEYLWSFDYRSKTWSYDKKNTFMIANPVINSTVTWDNLTPDWDDMDLTYPSWNQIQISETYKSLYLELNGRILKSDEESYLDWNGVDTDEGITSTIETKDYDFNDASRNKVYNRLGIKIEEETSGRSLDLTFAVSVSVNRGRSWKSCGTLIIPPNYDEGYVNFRALGSTARFRLVTNSQVGSYYVSELNLKVRASGDESRIGTQAP